MRRSTRPALEDGRSFQARALATELGMTPAQVAHAIRGGSTPDELRRLVRGDHRQLFLLVGANAQIAYRWMDERGISRNELGRSVIPTSMDPDRWRGRRGTVARVYHFDGDPRHWEDREKSLMEQLRISQHFREVHFVELGS